MMAIRHCIWRLKDWMMRHKIFLVITTISIAIGVRIAVRRRTAVSELNVDNWIKSRYLGCDVNFIGYGKKFAALRYAHVDVKTRTFSIPCVGRKPYYRFIEGPDGNILNGWMKNMTFNENSYSESIKTTNIAIFRTEAHNLYRSMCDWYNLFLVCSLLNLDPKKVTILLMDDRPPSLLEDVWYILFGDISRYQFLLTENVYKTLIWNIFGYESPMNNHQFNSLPYLQGFRRFIFNSYNIRPSRKLDCKTLNVTIIYRRDFMSHPERENALVHRKFHDNHELWTVVSEVFEGHKVTGLPLEYFSMKEQLQYITNTDILIGMHGAGLSQILFLPSHAGAFEIFPNYVEYHDRYKTLAKWTGIKYIRWRNEDPTNELPEYKTRIPNDVLKSNLDILKSKMCG